MAGDLAELRRERDEPDFGALLLEQHVGDVIEIQRVHLAGTERLERRRADTHANELHEFGSTPSRLRIALVISTLPKVRAATPDRLSSEVFNGLDRAVLKHRHFPDRLADGVVAEAEVEIRMPGLREMIGKARSLCRS